MTTFDVTIRQWLIPVTKDAPVGTTTQSDSIDAAITTRPKLVFKKRKTGWAVFREGRVIGILSPSSSGIWLSELRSTVYNLTAIEHSEIAAVLRKLALNVRLSPAAPDTEKTE